MFLFLGIFAGFLIPFQTSINTRLRFNKQSTILSTIISFLGGLLLTILVMLFNKETLLPNITDASTVIISALLGVLFVSGSIVVFDKLGATQTAILPVIGQVIAGLTIDHFGLFNSTITPITFSKLIGTLLVVIGVVGVVLSGTQKKATSASQAKKPLMFQLFAMSLGAFSTIQTALNSTIGIVLQSPYQSTYLSFVFGIIILVIIGILKKEPFTHFYTKHSPWWSYLGGIAGFTFVLSTIIITPIITTSMTVLTTLVGLTIGSLVIETNGLFQTPKRQLTYPTIVSLILLIGGVAMTQLMQ